MCNWVERRHRPPVWAYDNPSRVFRVDGSAVPTQGPSDMKACVKALGLETYAIYFPRQVGPACRVIRYELPNILVLGKGYTPRL